MVLRVGRYKKLPHRGRFGKDVIALATAGMHRIIVFANAPTEHMGEGEVDDGMDREVAGPDVKLQFFHDIGTKFQLNLSRMTEAELRTLKEAIDFAFSEALPICQERDTIAQKAADDGRGDYFRLYRATPNISYPQGKVRQDDQRVHVGREGVLESDALHAHRTSGPANGGGGVAEPDQAPRSSGVDHLPALGQPPLLG